MPKSALLVLLLLCLVIGTGTDFYFCLLLPLSPTRQFLWRFPNSETYLAQVLSEVKQDRAIRGAALPRPLRAALLATGPGHRRGALATAPAKGSHNSTPRHVMTSSGGPPHAGNGSTSV